ncbi:protein of unknown function [uncultured Sphingopyxis sp.]|uniref:Uncharacterized protein n=1 Tax=uncultured Sphingopyxis sp. TaxID=310581 RepID=A0A1Y5PZG0_9SPHN|nr:protein of unknown function [uncultured Sphingopyxis sp.]
MRFGKGVVRRRPLLEMPHPEQSLHRVPAVHEQHRDIAAPVENACNRHPVEGLRLLLVETFPEPEPAHFLARLPVEIAAFGFDKDPRQPFSRGAPELGFEPRNQPFEHAIRGTGDCNIDHDILLKSTVPQVGNDVSGTGDGAAVRAAGAQRRRREAAVGGTDLHSKLGGTRRPCTAAPPPVKLGLAETSPTLSPRRSADVLAPVIAAAAQQEERVRAPRTLFGHHMIDG